METSNLIECLTKEANKTLIMKFLHSCIGEICGSPGPNYEQFSDVGWTDEEYNYMYKILSSLFRMPAVLHLDDAKMPPEFFHAPEPVQGMIMDCLKVRREPLANALAMNYSQKTVPTVVDFDWRLNMVMGSSKVASLKEPLVQLDLRVKHRDEEKTVDVEMNRNELDMFIKALESVKE